MRAFGSCFYLFVLSRESEEECVLFEQNSIDRREIFDHKGRSYSSFIEVSTFPHPATEMVDIDANRLQGRVRALLEDKAVFK